MQKPLVVLADAKYGIIYASDVKEAHGFSIDWVDPCV